MILIIKTIRDEEKFEYRQNLKFPEE